MITTEQAHNNLKTLLHNGRMLVNGLPLTVNELLELLQGEQILFEKATQLDKVSEAGGQQESPQVEGKTVKFPVTSHKEQE